MWRWRVCAVVAVCTISGPYCARAQITSGDARLAGLIAGVALSDSGASSNPAHAGTGNETRVSIWAARLYGLAEIGIHGVSGSFRIGQIGAALRVRSIGFDRFSDLSLSLLVSGCIACKQVAESRLGAGFVLRRYSGSAAENRYALASKTGITLPVLNNLMIGASFERQVLRSEGVATGRGDAVAAGFALNVFDSLMLLSEVRKERFFPASFRAGFEMQAASVFAFRFGFESNPHRFAVGIGLGTGFLQADISSSYHSYLGLSSIVEIGIRI